MRRMRKGTKPMIALGAVIALIVAAFAAYVILAPEKGEAKEAECLLLIDRTGSRDDPTTLNRYKDATARTIQGCRDRKARLSIYYFDQTGPKLVGVGDGYNLFELPDKVATNRESRLQEEMDGAQASAQSVFDQPSGDARGSDVLVALSGAAQNINADSASTGTSQKYIIVLSDGLQTSGDVSVAGLTPDASVAPLVEQATRLGLIPQVSGTTVNFIGLGTGVAASGEQLPQWFSQDVKSFWEAVVQQGGGQLCVFADPPLGLPTSNCNS